MTQQEQEIALQFNKLRLLPGSWDKRFSNSMFFHATVNPHKEITTTCSEWIYRILYKYRNQLPVIYEKYKTHPHCNKKSR